MITGTGGPLEGGLFSTGTGGSLEGIVPSIGTGGPLEGIVPSIGTGGPLEGIVPSIGTGGPLTSESDHGRLELGKDRNIGEKLKFRSFTSTTTNIITMTCM